MKLDPVRFQTAFVQQARRPAAPEAPVDGLAPARPSLVQRALAFFQPAPKVAPQEQVALSSVLPALNGPAAVALAQQVALSQLTLADEEAVGKATTMPAGTGQDRVSALWARLAPHFPDLETPQSVDAPIGPGMFVGRSLFANGKEIEGLPEPVALFFLAHEGGHVEHRDAARKQGQAQLRGMGVDDALQQGDWAMEFAADRRAAEVVAKLGCDPGPILAELLILASGPEHPSGLDRAKAVRDVLGVGEERWQSLVESTAGRRAENQRKQDEAREWFLAQREII